MSDSNNYDTVWALARQHQEELLREAAQHRLAKAARPARKISFSLSSRIRWAVGRALVSGGFWLLSRPVGGRRLQRRRI